ncbi:unnamed protein product, partial [marine sediment metagenome]
SDGSCIAKLDFDGTTCGAAGQVCGWARALAPVGDPNAGGWDGWIKLRGAVQSDGSPYRVYLDSSNYQSLGYSEFRGWAWGGNEGATSAEAESKAVIGWISFNCNNPETGNVCGASDYKVMTSINLNVPPSATELNVTEGNYCFAPKPPIFLKWTFDDPDPGDTQSAYQVQIDGIDTGKVPLSSETYSPNLSFNTSYSWRVKVWDNKGAESEWSAWDSFATDPRWPWPEFDYSPAEPDIGEEIQFCSIN